MTRPFAQGNVVTKPDGSKVTCASRSEAAKLCKQLSTSTRPSKPANIPPRDKTEFVLEYSDLNKKVLELNERVQILESNNMALEAELTKIWTELEKKSNKRVRKQK